MILSISPKEGIKKKKKKQQITWALQQPYIQNSPTWSHVTAAGGWQTPEGNRQSCCGGHGRGGEPKNFL